MGDFDHDEMSIWPVNLTHIIGRAAGRRPVPTPNLLAMMDNPPRHQLEQVLPRVDTIEPLPEGQTRDVVLVDIAMIFYISEMTVSIAEIWGLDDPIPYRESVMRVLRRAVRRGYTIVMYNDQPPGVSNSRAELLYYNRLRTFLVSKLPGVKIIQSFGHPQVFVNYVTLTVRPSPRSVLIDDNRASNPNSTDQYGYLPLARRLLDRGVDMLRFSHPEVFPRREFNPSQHLTPGSTNIFALMGVGPSSVVRPLLDRLVDAGMTQITNSAQIPIPGGAQQSPALLFNYARSIDDVNVNLIQLLIDGVRRVLGPGHPLAIRILWFAARPDVYESHIGGITRSNWNRYVGNGPRVMELLEEPPIRVEI